MKDATNNAYYFLDIDDNGNIENPKKLMKGNAVIKLPLVMDGEIQENNLKIIKRAIDNGNIKTSGSDIGLTYDVSRCNLEYQEWSLLIDFAKKHNITFKVNLYEEYSTQEMKNYIEKFTCVDDGEKDFIFNVNYSHTLKDNKLKNIEESPIQMIEKENSPIDVSVLDRLFENYLDDVKKCGKKITFYLDKKFDEEAKNSVINAIDLLIKNKGKEEIYFQRDYSYLYSNELKLLLEVEEYIKENYNENYRLKICSDDAIYTKEQILYANNKIDEIVSELKEKDLSPYEKIIYVHKMLSELEYNEDDNSLDINIYGILNSKKIICYGYAALLKTIFTELNDSNIKVECDGAILYYNKNKTSNHMLNCVYLKDEKYGIEGYYNLDSCHEFGPKIYNSTTDKLNNFMIPVEDLKYSDANKFLKITKQMLVSNGNLHNQIFPFQKNRKNKYRIDVRNNRYLKTNYAINSSLESTKSFLDTPMCHKFKEELNKEIETQKDCLYVINRCVEETKPISSLATTKALIHVGQTCYDMDEEESEIYASNVILKNIFDSLFCYKRDKCKNDFCRKSLAAEKIKKNIIKNRK